jgi:hypothetical protein
MSYRPICDVWLLARSKVKYYGAYPAGFLSRAIDLLGVDRDAAVLHVCSGRVTDYPFKGFGLYHRTVDIDPAMEPDFCMDVREELPAGPWDAILADPPYSEADSTHYAIGDAYPEPNKLLKDCINASEGRR